MKPLGNSPFPLFLSRIYSLLVRCRNLCYDLMPDAAKKTGHYTISVGSPHAGGTGKTPLALLIGEHFYRSGYETVFLSRGYKRKSRGPVIVKPGQAALWEQTGDEPAMLRRSLPGAWLGVDADRYRTALLISPQLPGKAVFILDDGFQHRKLFRHKNIVCLPPDPFSDLLIPAGTLREPLSSLKRADSICIIGLRKDAALCEKSRRLLCAEFPGKQVCILYQSINHWVNAVTGEIAETLPLKEPLLISGIARPGRFVELVQETGVHPGRCMHYEDHHVFTADELEDLCRLASDGFITTEKDYCRLSSINLVNCKNIWYLKVITSFEDSAAEKIFFNNLLI